MLKVNDIIKLVKPIGGLQVDTLFEITDFKNGIYEFENFKIGRGNVDGEVLFTHFVKADTQEIVEYITAKKEFENIGFCVCDYDDETDIDEEDENEI